jgi:hypothetical protein
MKKLSLSAYHIPPRRKARRAPRSNPRVACGTVGPKRNKYVGGLVALKGKWGNKPRKIIGCATKAGDDRAFYATRVVGKSGTRYVPIPKAAVRGLHHRDSSRVYIPTHTKTTKTPASIIAAFEKRYAALEAKAKAKAKPAKRKPRANPARKTGKLVGAAKVAFLKRMAAGKRRAARR